MTNTEVLKKTVTQAAIEATKATVLAISDGTEVSRISSTHAGWSQ